MRFLRALESKQRELRRTTSGGSAAASDDESVLESESASGAPPLLHAGTPPTLGAAHALSSSDAAVGGDAATRELDASVLDFIEEKERLVQRCAALESDNDTNQSIIANLQAELDDKRNIEYV